MSLLISTPRTPGRDGQLGQLELVHGKLFMLRRLRERGLAGWQAPTTAALLAAWDLADADVFFDVGANIGIYSLLHAQQRPYGTAVAFEPTPDLVARGTSIAELNGLSVRWEQVAVSDVEGHATLYLSSKSDASNSLVQAHRRPKGTVSVATVTLDDYVRRAGLAPSVVKIDVERHEPAVIRGAAQLLAVHRPVVVAELLEEHAEGDEVRRMLDGHGYQSRHLVPAPGAQWDGAMRDWLFWPDAVPAEFDIRFIDWYAAVTRCEPTTVVG